MATSRSASETTTSGKDRFICVNILPPEVGAHALETLQEQINIAKHAGFTHAWINPIGITDKDAICHRTDLDTGLTTDLYGSLYAPIDPQQIRPDLPREQVSAILRQARADNFHVLVDFVWKHVNKNSDLAQTPGWGGKTFSDITEYDFDGKQKDKIYAHLKRTIDTLLNPDTGYGFSGLRIDAASHIKPTIRKMLYTYIREQYPSAIIMEECLFDSKEETNIAQLAREAQASDKKIYSDFITSNLYYQQPDVFGALPRPSEMGDSEKLKLSDQHGISFTGNHDHFSAGWSIILSMAAERASQHASFLSAVASSRNAVSPFLTDDTSNNEFSNLIAKMVKTGENPKPLLPENFTLEQQKCIRYLLPFANEIARELLDKEHQNHSSLFNQFQTTLFNRIANKTTPSMAGYFILFDELISPFTTPRIFLNSEGRQLPLVLLTIADLKENLSLTKKIISKMKAEESKQTTETKKTSSSLGKGNIKANKKSGKKQYKYANLTNFEKGRDLARHQDDDTLRFWLPYIVDYLRNHPEENEYPRLKPADISTMDKQLQESLGTFGFIQTINKIYAEITTLKCNDYYTFTTSNNCNITIRCNEGSTDIIILNLNKDKMITIDNIDLQKIAFYLQTRKFPIGAACINTGNASLSVPFSGTDIVYPPHGYLPFWQQKAGAEFDDAYNRVVGSKAGHQTNLYLGTGIRSEIKSDKVNVRVHVQTEQEKRINVFHETSKPLTPTNASSPPTKGAGV